MNLIYEIYKKLRQQEIRYLKQQFQTAVFEHEKVGKLFELVTQFEEREEDFYAEKLYGKAADNTFRVTKARLKRLMENVLLNDKSLSGYPTEIINQQLQLRKKLLQAEILLGRGAYQAGRYLLLQCIASAKRYHLYQELFQGELLMYRYLSVRVSADEFEEDWQRVQQLNHESASINEALLLHYYTSNRLARKSLNQQELADIRRQIDRMRDIHSQIAHPLVANAFYLSEIYYLQATAQYATALEYCQKYLKLIADFPDFYTKARLANAYIQLAQVALQLSQSELARENTDKALQLFSKEEMNYLVTLELVFRTAFHGRRYYEAEQVIQAAFAHPQFHASKLLNAQWHYFNACISFKRGDYRQAIRQLNEATPLMADKFGKNIDIRLLEMMIFYELQSHEALDLRIQNVKPFMRRENENQRASLLYKLLLQWARVGYDFAAAYKKASPILQELHDYHQSNPLRATDFELIRLDEWMAEKMGWAADR